MRIAGHCLILLLITLNKVAEGLNENKSCHGLCHLLSKLNMDIFYDMFVFVSS